MTERQPSSAPDPTTSSQVPSIRRGVIAAIGVLDAVVLLLPPFHWALGDLTPVAAFLCFAGACLLVTVSLVVINALDHDGEV